ncbi:MAG: PorT family protein [Bacteroidales bacterium]|nr:PorT family protein [Bacteroidales bacterium]
MRGLRTIFTAALLLLAAASTLYAGPSERKKETAGKKAAADTTVVTDTIQIGDFGHITVENVKTKDDFGQLYTDEFLDTVQVKKKFLINDYTMVGVQYGVCLNRMSFNPTMGQSWQFKPMNIGIMYTRYGKIFGYMPYFGLQIGLFYGQEGYKLDEGYNIRGAREAVFDILELASLAHFHFDFWKMKFIVNIGPYVSYRTSITRSGDTALPPSLVNSFLSTDRQWDYGIKGGGGIGLIFDPIEIHFQVMYKFGFGLMYDPSYYSEYYYRFATVSNLIVSVGVHFQLTKRSGRSTHALRKQAQDVYLQRKYGTDEDEQ